MSTRGNPKVRVAQVLSHKMNKTVIVSVSRVAQDPTFKKYVKKSTKFKAHDEKGECRVGDLVELIETKPMSKEKRWRVQKILKKGLEATA